MVGVDEVGRGCLAGPMLVVAAKANSDLPDGLRDSKLMSRKQRVEMLELLNSCCDFSEGWVKATEIDRHGLAEALKLGVKRALSGLGIGADEEVILDGKVNYVPKKFKRAQCIIDADNLIPIVSAAGIYAKVKRDGHMTELAKKHPRYLFEKHVGYGTAEHLKALNSYGVIRFVHRSSFMPITKLLAGPG